jgi:DNA-binding transcriptional LysR family regulator
LAALNIDWPIGIEASSLALIQEYALNGYGLGLSLTIPNNRLDSRLRAIPPEGFEPVEIGVLWQGEASPLAQAFIQAMQERAQVVGG